MWLWWLWFFRQQLHSWWSDHVVSVQSGYCAFLGCWIARIRWTCIICTSVSQLNIKKIPNRITWNSKIEYNTSYFIRISEYTSDFSDDVIASFSMSFSFFSSFDLFLSANIYYKSLHDLHHTVLGFLSGWAATQLLTEFLKKYAGRPRPY